MPRITSHQLRLEMYLSVIGLALISALPKDNPDKAALSKSLDRLVSKTGKAVS
jgi:hypothetical protein